MLFRSDTHAGAGGGDENGLGEILTPERAMLERVLARKSAVPSSFIHRFAAPVPEGSQDQHLRLQAIQAVRKQAAAGPKVGSETLNKEFTRATDAAVSVAAAFVPDIGAVSVPGAATKKKKKSSFLADDDT